MCSAVLAGSLGACGGGGDDAEDTPKREIRADAVDFCRLADEYDVLFNSTEPVPEDQLRAKLLEVYADAPSDLRLAIDRLSPYLDLMLEIRLDLIRQPSQTLAKVAERFGVEKSREVLATVIGVSNEVAAACGKEPIGLGAAAGKEVGCGDGGG